MTAAVEAYRETYNTKHTYIHTYIHTYTHTHTYTQADCEIVIPYIAQVYMCLFVYIYIYIYKYKYTHAYGVQGPAFGFVFNPQTDTHTRTHTHNIHARFAGPRLWVPRPRRGETLDGCSRLVCTYVLISNCVYACMYVYTFA